MTVSAGTRLGPYEILAPLGKGGMGEVWKARDTRLGRDVAIKISAEQFSERFEREARAVAALNHPNICTLYDVGPNYLVMEYIEGTPLKGPLPVEKAVEYSGQILDALDAAHSKGITHRDLKPANILVTKQGIKLLDFGLAKQAVRLSEYEPTKALTDQGQIIGTLQYMSPEQLQGKEADPRSDLFSFGCVLYEMLTGKRAFEGQSSASVIAAILEREPARLAIAPPLERVVRTCLAKDPDGRFQTARDAKRALTWALEQPPAAVANQPRSKVPWVVAGVPGLALIVLGAWFWRTTQPGRASSDAAKRRPGTGRDDRSQSHRRHLTRRPTAGLSGARSQWQAAACHATAGPDPSHSAARCGKRRRSVFLSGQPIGRILRGWKTQKDLRRGCSASDSVRCHV